MVITVPRLTKQASKVAVKTMGHILLVSPCFVFDGLKRQPLN